MPAPLRTALVLGFALSAALTACGQPEGSRTAASPGAGPSLSATPTPAAPTPATPTTAPTTAPAAAPTVSVLGLAAQTHTGDRLRLGAVRERTAAYTSYDVTYRSRSTTARGEEAYTISGVLNVPTGPGPFPAVVLAHGYIDPAVYVRGQGMTRERGYLAARGYLALHVDYRNHAESDDDRFYQLRMRLGYSADVINAVKALRGSDLPVDQDRVFFFGRSMGGGVVLKALVAEPGLVRGAALWASVSSLEGENYDRFIGPDPADDAVRGALERRYGSPAQNPGFWRQNSSRPYLDRVTEPVLLVHGRNDATCPPRWATATRSALVAAGVDATLQWYDDGHAFGPAFNAAMDRTLGFFGDA